VKITVNFIAEALFLLSGKSGIHLCLRYLVSWPQNVCQFQRVRHFDKIKIERVAFNVDQNITLVINGKCLIFHTPLLNPTCVVISEQFVDQKVFLARVLLVENYHGVSLFLWELNYVS